MAASSSSASWNTPEFSITQPPQISYAGREFEHLILRIRDPERGEIYRVITFQELVYIPTETREDPDVLGKQWAVIRGLYAADVDFVYTAMGVYRPEHLGVGQFYGAAAEAYTETMAIREARKRMDAVIATMANFPHMKLKPPAPERIGLLLNRIERLPRIIAILGHPDPRYARKGMGRDGSLGDVDDEMLAQQGENMLRGLAKIRRDFVFTVTASHIDRGKLSDALVKMSRWSSVYASRQRGALGASFSIAIPLAAALGANTGASHGSGQTHATSHSDGMAQAHGTSEAHSWGHSVSHGETHGEADTSSVAVTNGTVVSHGGGVTHSQANTSSWAHTTSQAQTHSVADTQSWAHTTSHGTSVAHSSGTSHSVSDGVSSNWSSGASTGDTTSHGTTQSQSAGMGVTNSSAHAQGSGTMQSNSVTNTQSATGSLQISDTTSHTDSSHSSNSLGGGVTMSGGAQVGIPGVVNVSGNTAVNVNGSHSWGSGAADGAAHGVANGTATTTGQAVGSVMGSSTSQVDTNGTAVSQNVTVSSGQSAGSAHSVGASHSVGGGTSHSVSSGSFQSTTHGESWGTADTRGGAHTVGNATTRGSADTRGGAHSTGVARSSTWGVASSHSVTAGRSHTVSRSESIGEGWSEGRTTGRSDSWGRSHSDGQSQARSLAMSGSRGYLGGLGAGIVPGISLTRSWQSEDDVAIRMTEISRQLVSLLNLASLEGGFYTTATLAVDDAGLKPAMATVTQSFHGKDVPTPIQPVQADDALRPFMIAFRPSLMPDGDPFGVGLWTKWGTLHTVQMLAALTAPNLFEEGVAMTVQERIPSGLAFYPLMEGDVILGHQVSPETYDLTTAPLKLARKRHFHTAFMGDTGYGKTVAAERMAYETTIKWKMKTVVLDFGAGWRKMLNAPGLDGHVEIRQLSPGGVRPLRWNPLQIGRNILPEVQWRSFCDIFGNIAQLGGKRQIHELRAMLHTVYVNAGVLTDDPEVRQHPAWGFVASPEEAALVGKPKGTPLDALTRDERQLLAVRRSQTVDLKMLYDALEKEIETIPAKDIRRSILEGISFRLDPLVHGEAAMQYAAGDDAIDINDIVPGDWGIAVLEGGAFLDDFSKAFLLGWVAWHIYTDAVIQRIQRSKSEPAHIQIVFEEANKILSGVGDKGGGEEGGMSLAEQFAAMWRDSRKYGIFLHLITQTPSEIPPGIMSSCNNIFASQLKNVKDLDIAIQSIHRSPKGFTDEGWRRFMASIPVARAVAKLGYNFDRGKVEPVYIQPKLLNIDEPNDADIEARLGAITL